MTAPTAVVDACTCPSPRGCERCGPQPRERAVPCSRCGQHTWNVTVLCDRCLVADTVRTIETGGLPPLHQIRAAIHIDTPGRASSPGYETDADVRYRVLHAAELEHARRNYHQGDPT